MGYKRSDRVGDLIREVIAGMLIHGDLKDPRIGFVTLTVVKMSNDLKNAHVYFSRIGTEEEIAESVEGLNSASGFIRRRLAKELDLKYIPVIKFEYDDSIAYSDHMSKVLRDMDGSDVQ